MITARIKPIQRVQAKIRSPDKVEVVIGNLVISSGTGAVYDGSYSVTPKAHEQTVLPTAHKTLTRDVVVLEVPFYEVSNGSGNTVYIADTNEVV